MVEVEVISMNSKTILAALVAITIGGATAVPALAANNQQQQMMMQMLMQQQQAQQQVAVTQANQAAAAEAAWQAQNGSYPYKDQFGRAYGPSGYAPNSGAVNSYGLPFVNGILPVGYQANNNCNVGYGNPYNYNNGYNANASKIQRKLAREYRKLNQKVNRTLRIW